MAGAAGKAGALVGSVAGGIGEGMTANQRRRIRQATEEQQAKYGEAEGIVGAGEEAARGELEQYATTGEAALKDLYAMASGEWNYKTDPGYEFRRGEGERAIDRAAGGAGARGGGRYSGATLKALTAYGQDFASNEYGRAYARREGTLAPIAGMGYGARTTRSGITERGAAGRAGYRAGVGEAGAAGAMAQAGMQSDVTTGLSQGIGQGVAAYYGAQ